MATVAQTELDKAKVASTIQALDEKIGQLDSTDKMALSYELKLRALAHALASPERNRGAQSSDTSVVTIWQPYPFDETLTAKTHGHKFSTIRNKHSNKHTAPDQ